MSNSFAEYASEPNPETRKKDVVWFALNDDQNRMVVAVNYNTDIGDAWEFADVPYYPEKYASAAFRLGINYIIYSMTH